MASGDQANTPHLTAEQHAALAELLKPLVEALSHQWRPLVEALGPSLTAGVPALEEIARQMREAFSSIRLPSFSLPGIDLNQLLAAVPPNLRAHLARIEDLATLALSDGIPIAWVPRSGLLDDLLSAPTATERYQLLMSSREEILDDCVEVLAGRNDPWSDAARKCVDAVRNGSDDAAQSHAANVIDSVILAVFSDPEQRRNAGRARATVRAIAAANFDLNAALREVVRHLTVRPVPRALAPWFPSDPPPTAFSRHATAHCVGSAAVFNESFCIVSVMLATSLARQFGK